MASLNILNDPPQVSAPRPESWQCPLKQPIKVKAPDFFHGKTGEDAKLWLSRLERFHQCSGIGPDIAPFVFPTRLDGLAEQWFSWLPDHIAKDYAQLRAAFLKRFHNEAYVFEDGLQMFLDLQSKGIPEKVDWDDLVLQHSRICDSLGFTREFQRVESFISILPTDVRNYVKICDNSDLTQCALNAKRIIKSQNVHKRSNETVPSFQNTESSPKVNTIHAKTKKNRKFKPKTKQLKKWPCTYCGANNHKTKHCPKQRLKSPEQTKTEQTVPHIKTKQVSNPKTKTESSSTNFKTSVKPSSKRSTIKTQSKVDGPAVCPIFELSQGSHIKVSCSNDVELHTLIDTGANCNCISLDAYNRLSSNDKTLIEKHNFTQATSAGGSPLQIKGVSTISFKLNNSYYDSTTYVVKDLVVDLILGTKFLEAQGAVIDFSKSQIRLNDSYNLIMPRDFTLQGGSEAILLVDIKSDLPNEIDGLVKPNSLVRSFGLFMANSLGTTKQNKVPIRLFNPFEKPFKIKAKTKLGTFNPLSSNDTIEIIEDPDNRSKIPSVNQISTDQTTNNTQSSPSSKFDNSKHHHNLEFSEARIRLKESINLGKSDLTDDQKEQLLDVLAEHREAFSLEGELGNCTLIDHEISLKPGTRPIYQQP